MLPLTGISSVRFLRGLSGLVLAVLASPYAHAAPTTPIGATAGSFSVDANGGANYSIPVFAPPGTAGMVPKLALNYNRQLSAGYLANGWSVSGLSVIQRCGRTQPLDGIKGGVNYDDNDRFCLDGQRLVAINNGTYGADGTEYRTERESFSRIVSYRDASFTGKGPQYFRVTTSAGQVLEYGVSADSRIEAAPKNGVTQTTVRLWTLNKVQDLTGNYFTISYFEDNAKGEYRPTRIDFTGNAGAGLNPYNSVQFVYEATDRPDVVVRYEGGSVIKSTRRLTNLRSFAGTTLVRDYRLTYDNSGAAGDARLTNLVECGNDNVCLNPTTFGWQANNDGFTIPDYNNPVLPAQLYDSVAKVNRNTWCGDVRCMKVADFNGDGRTDYMWQPSDGDGRWLIVYGTATGFTAPDYNNPVMPAKFDGTYNSWNNDDRFMYFVDFNGDGKLDFLWRPNNGDGRWVIAYGTATGFTIPDYNNPVLPAQLYDSVAKVNRNTWGSDVRYMKVADFNGDGRTDYMWKPSDGDGRWLIVYGTATGFTTPDYNQPALPSQFDGTHDSWPYNNDFRFMYFADFNGDGKLDYLWAPGDGDWRWVIAYGSGAVPNLLSSVTTGTGHVTNVEQKPLTDGATYSKDFTPLDCPYPNITSDGHAIDTNCYPYQNIQNATYVVSRYTASDGLGGAAGVSYKYTGAKSHLYGGWLGFRELQVTDERTGNKTISQYDQNFEAGTAGEVLHSESWTGTVRTGMSDNFYSVQTFTSDPNYAGQQKFVRIDGTLAQTFELDGTAVSCAQLNSTYDNFGFAVTAVSKVDAACGFTNAFTKTVTSTYDHDTVNWRLGRVTRAQTTNEAPGQLSITRTAAIAYSSNGLPTSNTIEPDSATQRVTSSYAHDAFGNVTKTTVSGPDFVTRDVATVTYDTRGQFPVVSMNALGQSETRVFDLKWGVVTSQTGPNGLTTTFDYDGLGRLVSTISPDNKVATTAIALCDGSDADCPQLAKTRVTTTISGAGTIPPSHVYADLLGRTLRTKGTAFNNQTVYQDTEYNNLGQLYRSSLPYYAGSNPSQWTVYAYDAAGRTTSVAPPDGNPPTTTTYSVSTGTGPKVCITNTLYQQSCVQKNVAGQAKETTDTGGTTSYFYDAGGNVTKVIDPANNTVLTAQYDLMGRKTSMADADAGVRTYNYSYNAFGEQVFSETDAKGQTTTVTYDLLGRVKTRTNLEGAYTWSYDTRPMGIGKLASVTGPNYSRTPTYDNLGRELSVQTVINGTSYSVATAYDSQGRPDTLTYPTGFKTKNVYDTSSRLIEVRDGSSSALYWKANAYDQFGSALSFTLGNGLTTDLTYDPLTHALKTVRTGVGGAVQSLDYGFDALGNLTSRTENNQSYTETFGYDALNRLTSVSGPSPKIYGYDSIGNITTKTDVGSYVYAGPRPHAVTSTAGTINTTYAYDANGNIISGAGRNISYTSFNKPAQITTNGVTTSFTYGPNLERLTKTNAQGETLYLGKLYEQVTQGTNVIHKHYVVSPSGLVAVVSQGAVSSVRYLHGDHLGSTNVITDEAGNVVERLSFDPFGARRQPNGLDPTQLITSSVNRGYTGHEHDDESSLINMNAREYDPVLGRFLQPDSNADGGLSQGFNRYSYVGNNPLSMVDPSGNKARWKANLDFAKKHGWLPMLSPTFVHFGIVKDKQEEYLADNPKLQPYVKAIGGAVLTYYGGAAAVPAIDAIFDYRMCEHAGGQKCNVVGEQTLVRGYVIFFASWGWSEYQSGSGTSAPTSTPPPSSTTTTLIGSVGRAIAKTWAVQQAEQAGLNGDAVNLLITLGDGLGYDISGRIWAGPNTVIGLTVGMTGYALGEASGTKISLANGAIEFVNLPFGNTREALTLGDVILYGPGANPEINDTWYGIWQNMGLHELAHVPQFRTLGPFFLPTYFAVGGFSQTNTLELAASYAATNQGSWWPW